MGQTFFFQWEVDLILWLQAHLGAVGEILANIASLLGGEVMIVLLLGFFYWGANKKLGLTIGLNASVAGMWNPMMKNIALRRRPYFDHPDIRCLKPVDAKADLYSIAAQGYSFPSGHSTNSAAAYGTIALWAKKTWVKVLCVLVPLLVGISRFCVGVHYPTDVLVGWLLAVLSMVIISVMEKKIARKWVRYLILIATAVPGLFYCKTNDFFTFFGLACGVMLGNLFEEKFVNFRETKNITAIILRLLGGLVMYLLLDKVLKLPFSAEFLADGSMASMMVRASRYFIIIFMALGVYPMVFERIPLMKG